MAGRKAPRSRRPSPRRPAPRPADSGSKSLIELRLRSDRLEDVFSDLLRDPRGGVRLISCRPSTRGSGTRLLRWLELETTSAAGKERVRELAKQAGSSVFSMAQPGADRAIIRLSSPLPGVCEAVFAAGAMCAACPLLAGDHDGSEGTFRILIPRNAEAMRFRRELGRRLGGHLAVERAGRPRISAGLTPRQDQAFRVAFELGYFSYPRRADLGAVANRLGVSRSTTLELLRHAIREMALRRFLAGDGAHDRF